MTAGVSFWSLWTSFNSEIGDWTLGCAQYNQDRDDDVEVLELRKSIRTASSFLLNNPHSAQALTAPREANPLDQCPVASVALGLRSCFGWKPKKSNDMQVWAKTLCNTFGGGQQSFREHLAEGRAAVASWQIGFERCLTKESCGKGEFSYRNRRFKHVHLKAPSLVKRRVAFDSMYCLLHQLHQLNICGKFAAMLGQRGADERPTL